MLIGKYSKTGSYHKEMNEENQDYLYSVDNKDITAIMLADGATACKKGLDGARLACEAVSYMINTGGVDFFSFPPEKLAYLLTEEILYNLECNKESSVDISEYGSTFMLALLDKKTGSTRILNLGDGAVISAKETGISLIMRPRRYGGNPCLTTTKGADRAISIKTEYLPLGGNIILCSDGFYEQLCRAHGNMDIQSFITQGDESCLLLGDNADDSSCISLVRERK